ncbi:MAG: hypothetical protein HYU78_13710 [Rhodocyclales bacterium]|nr:hypothetical protein [Rhodocyclales bacterium]
MSHDPLRPARPGAPGPTVTAAPAGLSWPLLVGAATFLLLLTRPELLNDGDTWWHIATGRWIFAHGAVPASDPFSHTFPGAPWTAHEWLAELFFAAAHAAAGWSGVLALTAAAAATTLALLTRYLLRHLAPIHALLFVALGAGLMLPHLLARPHALAAPLVVLWAIALVRAREAERTPGPLALAALLLWANLHGSFPLALLLAGAFAGEAVLAAPAKARRPTLRRWGLFLAVAFAVTLLTPHGFDGWRFAADFQRLSFSLSRLGEWRSPDFQRLQPLEIWLLAGAALALVRGLRLPPLRIALLLGLLHLALQHVRHGELLGLLAPVIVAQPFAAQLASSTEPENGIDRCFLSLAPPAGRAATAAVLALMLGAAVLAHRLDAVRPAAAATPAAAVQAARAAAAPGPVFNAYEFGGYLIFAGIPPFIDARADFYGDAFVARFYRAVTVDPPELLPQLLDQHRIGWTLLQPQLPAVAALDRLPGWRRLHTDATAVVHVRVPAAGQ